jgi:hypothetical protein
VSVVEGPMSFPLWGGAPSANSLYGIYTTNNARTRPRSSAHCVAHRRRHRTHTRGKQQQAARRPTLAQVGEPSDVLWVGVFYTRQCVSRVALAQCADTWDGKRESRCARCVRCEGHNYANAADPDTLRADKRQHKTRIPAGGTSPQPVNAYSSTLLRHPRSRNAWHHEQRISLGLSSYIQTRHNRTRHFPHTIQCIALRRVCEFVSSMFTRSLCRRFGGPPSILHRACFTPVCASHKAKPSFIAALHSRATIAVLHTRASRACASPRART